MQKYSTLLISVFSLQLWAATQAPKPDEKAVKNMAELHPLMYKMLGEITALQPFMTNRQRFESKVNHAEINKRLSELSRLSAQVMTHKNLQTASYSVSGEALNQQIQNTQRAFQAGSSEYARQSLTAVPFACASCHTQGTSGLNPLWSLKEEDLEGSRLERADFLFSTRNYDAAEKIYTQMIRTFAGNSAPADKFQDPGDLENALKKKLTIWIRINRDLPEAKKSLQADLNNKNIPAGLQALIRHWLKQIDKINAHATKELALKNQKLLKLTRSKVPANTKGFISGMHPELVRYLWISGLIYEQLNNQPDPKLIPEFLYRLALIDFALNHEFFYSLGNTYLRDCIVSYPRAAITKKCYQEYELEITQLYTGTRGTDIPTEVEADLKRLKVLAIGKP